MSSQKVVRCEVKTKPGLNASVRYVPLEIYGLWSYLMEHKHGFEIAGATTSLWLDLEESPEAAYGAHSHEAVTELSLFVYSDPAGMFTRVCRYFPSAEYDTLKPIFLSHYRPDAVESGADLPLRERKGLWIRREHAAA